METDPLEAEEADVYQGDRLVGRMERKDGGTVFSYHPSVQPGEPGIASQLPTETRTYFEGGGAVHPFFAGLLPEGARLVALAGRLKTSLDDAFSLLLAVGEDCVGDVSVVPAGLPPVAPVPFAPGDPSDLDFQSLFEQSVGEGPNFDHVALAGVQEKVSAAMVSFPLRSSAILKLNPPRFALLVENEAFFLRMASALGVGVNEAHLVYDRSGRSGLLVKRFDRFELGGSSDLTKTHQEDACQFNNAFPAAKYRLSSRDVAKGLAEYASSPPIAIREFVRQSAVNYLIGNGDFHAKNLSVYRLPRTGLIEVTPAYDVLSTLPYRHLNDRMVMKMDERDKDLKRRHFVEFADRHGAGAKAIHTLIDRICDASPPWIDRLEEIGFEAKTTEHLRRTILQRREDLGRVD